MSMAATAAGEAPQIKRGQEVGIFCDSKTKNECTTKVTREHEEQHPPDIIEYPICLEPCTNV